MPTVLSDPAEFANIPVVGIVGGISAGKSSVVQNVSDLRLWVIDADRVGHELLLTNDIREKLSHAFGLGIFANSGLVLRSRLAEIVFGDSDEQKNNRSQLNKILHPAIRNEIHRLIRQAPQDADAIILDAALLLEAGWAVECDAVIFVDTPDELRYQRAAANRGWSMEELQRREASQWSLLQKRQNSQFVVNNSGSMEEAAEQMKLILEKIIKRHSAREVLNHP